MEESRSAFELYEIFIHHAKRVSMLAPINPEQAEAHENTALALIQSDEQSKDDKE